MLVEILAKYVFQRSKKPENVSLVFVYINIKCAIGTTIKSEIIVLSINITNNSNKFTGIDDARISPPTSDR